MREVTLLLHFIGLGLLITSMLGGFFMHRQYRKAPDLRTKAIILKSARPFGLLSPIAMLLMLITGIGNMHALGIGIIRTLIGSRDFILTQSFEGMEFWWLSAKLVFYAIAFIAGIVLGIFARKRGTLVHAMSLGEGGPDAKTRLALYDTLIAAGHVIMPVLMISILSLSVYGRLGGQ